MHAHDIRNRFLMIGAAQLMAEMHNRLQTLKFDPILYKEMADFAKDFNDTPNKFKLTGDGRRFTVDPRTK